MLEIQTLTKGILVLGHKRNIGKAREGPLGKPNCASIKAEWRHGAQLGAN